MSTDQQHEMPRRTRGKRAGLDRAIIVEAARALAPEELTMQAVADRLGVDRKALNHHISDRDRLLELVAVDAFETQFTGTDVSGGDWKTGCRAFASRMKDSLIATGALAEYFRFTGSGGISALEATETLLEKMVAAGFDEATAARSLTLLTNVAMSHARDVVVSTKFGLHPQTIELQQFLESPAAPPLVVLRRVLAEVGTSDEAQFAHDVDVLLLGMEQLLRHSSRDGD